MRRRLEWVCRLTAVTAAIAISQTVVAQHKAGTVAPAEAGRGLPKPPCTAPAVPDQFKSKRANDHFVDQARVFETCIEKFIVEQKKLSASHARAGNDAAAVFNRFAAAAAKVKPAPEGY